MSMPVLPHLPYRLMQGRSREEPHRSATPLELFFDLCFVVAIAQGASELHHTLTEGHAEHILDYMVVFTAIWWAWMNFTWFASAYDTDDAPYRLAAFVQIAGALIMAAGIPRAFEDADFTFVAGGYALIRVGQVSLWLRAALGDPEHRSACLRYALGLTVVQVLWLAWLAIPDALQLGGWLTLIVVELSIPIWAERAAPTSWHAEHITERYGLFTIIVLGESILAATIAFQSAFDSGPLDLDLALLALSSVTMVCGMWWIYFDHATGPGSTSDFARSFLWGYGHLPLFSAAAAVGAGMAVNVDFLTDHSDLGVLGTRLAVSVPAAIFLVSLWLVAGGVLRTRHHLLLPAGAALILAGAFASITPLANMGLVALVMVTEVVIHASRPAEVHAHAHAR
jgi:low temperature requirement protein LtrA